LHSYLEHLRQLSLGEPTICAADDSHHQFEPATQSTFI
jgi:hypothetical protein